MLMLFLYRARIAVEKLHFPEPEKLQLLFEKIEKSAEKKADSITTHFYGRIYRQVSAVHASII